MASQPPSKQTTGLLALRMRDLPFTQLILLLLTTATVCSIAWLWLSNDGLVSTHLPMPKQIPTQFQIDINQATSPEIAHLPQIGPSLAEAIVAYRDKHGPLASFEELTRVPGIGQKKLAAIVPFLLPLP